MKLVTLVLLASMTACAAPRESVTRIGTASKSSDFADYALKRVGILFPEGDDIDPEFRRALRDALASELATATAYEIVPLDDTDVESVAPLEPAHSGRIRPAPVLELARRSSLDGLITTRVLELRPYAPVRLVLSIDLIVVETGFVTWSGSVRVDMGDRETREAVGSWQTAVRGANETERAIDTLSPLRISEFAAAQAALLL